MTTNEEFEALWNALPAKGRFKIVAEFAGVSVDTVRAWRVATGRSGRTIPASRLALIKREIARAS